jgi:hypothetical protein
MSEEIVSLANQILDATRSGRLTWVLVSNPKSGEEFRADIGDEQYITVRRIIQGDNRQISLELSQGDAVILEGKADNYISAATGSILATLGIASASDAVTGVLGSLHPELVRFNLFSDLFMAAKRVATGQESAIAKFKSTLNAKLGASPEIARQLESANSPKDETSNAA